MNKYSKYRRPLLAVAAGLAISNLLSACVVVPAGYYHRYPRRYYSEATPAQTAAPQTTPSTAAAATQG